MRSPFSGAFALISLALCAAGRQIPFVPTPDALPLPAATSTATTTTTTISDPQPTDPTLINRRPAVPYNGTSQLDDLRTAANFASASYCADVVERGRWSCGTACEALGPVQVLEAGGDGDATPYYYIALQSRARRVVVAHQGESYRRRVGPSPRRASLPYSLSDSAHVPPLPGTNTNSILSILDDLDLFPVKLDPLLASALNVTYNSSASVRPSSRTASSPLPDNVAARHLLSQTSDADGHIIEPSVHQGFQRTWNTTIANITDTITAAVTKGDGVDEVLVTGHSLGAAIALMDGLALNAHLTEERVGRKVNVKTILFGLPRVGNKDFADLVDARYKTGYLGIIHHLTNYNDIVPHLPPIYTGYWHTAGELWIPSPNLTSVEYCPGQENQNCADSVADNLGWAMHDGPYVGIRMGWYGNGECTNTTRAL